MAGATKLFILFLLFYFAGWQEAGEVEAVLMQPNRSIILGQVQGVERDFPQVTLTVRVIKSYGVQGYLNLIKEDEVMEIQPNYAGKEFKISSFFENERNLNNLQGYYFLGGDYFLAEVSLLGDERTRKVLYLSIQRLNVESALKMIEEPGEFLGPAQHPLDITYDKLIPKPPQEYAKLASVLYQLTQASERSEFARRYGLYLVNSKVRVVIELVPDCEILEEEYGMVVEGRGKNLIKGLMPVDRLMSLARDPSVGFIRPPHKPYPLSTPG